MVLTTSNHEGGLGFGSEMENTMNISTTELVPTHYIKKRQTRDLIECMEVANAVGTGTYGVVYKAIDKSEITRPPVALKKIKMERETQGFPVTAIREIKILHLMNHDHIIKLREIITYDKESNDEKEKNELKLKGISLGDVFMVFEYIEYDLDGLIKSPNFYLTPDMIKSYMYQLLSGILYLHDKKILHRDIKSANLLISKNNILKIADWGLARTLPPPNHKLTVPVVTLWYRSPELVFGTKHYGTEIDMWSVGCIFAELRQKSELFRAGTESEIIELIFRLLGTPQGSLLDLYKTYPDWEKINFTKTYQSRLTSEYSRQFDTFGLSLLERLLDLNPATRITAKEALEHRYFSPDTLPTPSNLPPIDLAPVTGWAQQEKAKKEREEQRKAAELQASLPPQPVRPPNPPPPPSAIQGTARPKNARDRDRENNPKLNKFNIIKKPSAAAGGAPPPPTAPLSSTAPPIPVSHDRREEDRPPIDDVNGTKRQKTDHYPSSAHLPPPPPLAPPPAMAHYPSHLHHPTSHYPPRSPRSSYPTSYQPPPQSYSHPPPQSHPHPHHHEQRPPPPPLHPSQHHNQYNRDGSRDNNTNNNYYRR